MKREELRRLNRKSIKERTGGEPMMAKPKEVDRPPLRSPADAVRKIRKHQSKPGELDLQAVIRVYFPAMLKLKGIMLARKIRTAWTWCPLCPPKTGRVDAALHGPRNHLHTMCQRCGAKSME